MCPHTCSRLREPEAKRLKYSERLNGFCASNSAISESNHCSVVIGLSPRQPLSPTAPLRGSEIPSDYSGGPAGPGATLGGGRRRLVAVSKAWARRSRVGSLHARPRNVSPIGVPSAV